MTPTCKWPIIGKQAPGNQCKKRSHFKRRLKMIVRITAEMNRIVVKMICASTPTCKWPIIGKQAPGNQCKKRSHFKRRLKMIVRITAEMNRIVVKMICASTTCAEFITCPMFSHYIFRVNVFPSVLLP